MTAQPDLILIADGSHARLISHSHSGDSLVWSMESREAAAPSRELGTDKPGRAFDGAIAMRSAMEWRTGPHRAAQLAFAREVADKVEESLTGAAFHKFVVVAGPRTIGDLRREFCDQVLEAISAELQKDLVALSDDEVVAHIKGEFVIH